MTKDLRDAVAVVTGASSGIGRATAVELARHGATVIAVARRERPLRGVADECGEVGPPALPVSVDVTDERAVDALGKQAVERYGRLDVWVNNAAVIAFSRFAEAPVELDRRVFEVNVLGYLHGARAALPWFREQGSGVLINVGSVLSRLPSPYLTSYVMSKHAIRALSACLRCELLDAPGIHVCTVMPGGVDTPLFDHAANLTGRALRAPAPVYPPEQVARTVVACARRPRDEVLVGWMPRLLALQHVVARGLVERASGRAVHRRHFGEEPAEPVSGNLFEPMDAGATASGGWRAGTSPIARRVAVAAGAVALARRGPGRWGR